MIGLAVLLGLYCLAVGFVAWQQRSFIYVPDTHRPDITATKVANARVVTVHTLDGLDLQAWFAPGSDAAQPVVLYLHGNGGNLADRAGRFAQLHEFGWGVLMVEYRGYGGNPGKPAETGLSQDAMAGYVFLRDQAVAPEQIVLWGESLGTGVAVRLAAKAAVGAVLLESPYTSIAAIGELRFPWMPVRWLLRDRFDLIARIGDVHAPVLVMTGAKDDIVPADMGRMVFAAANQPKQFWLAPDAGHADLAESGAFAVLWSFVRKYVGA